MSGIALMVSTGLKQLQMHLGLLELTHASVVFNNKMWVLGGRDESSNKNDVWSSSDGINWTQATANAPWTARQEYTSVVFNNKMWVLGGYDGSYKNDVWSSSDGVNWTQATANASLVWSI